MRLFFLVVSITVSMAGCTSRQLQFSTGRQAMTLADLQHRMVLNNLATFACNPDAIPSHVNLSTGTTQVTDTGTPAANLITGYAVALTGSRSVVEEWNTTPVADPTSIGLLQIAYRRALGSDEDLYSSKSISANDLAQQLKTQTFVVDDMRTLNEELGRNRAEKIHPTDFISLLCERIARCKESKPKVECCKTECEYGVPKETADRYKKDAREYISTNSDEIVLTGEILTPQNLVATPVNPSTGCPINCECKGCRYKVATPLAQEVRRQVFETNHGLNQIHAGWLGVGGRKDVPSCACHVGHHRECGRDCYVWVLPGCEKEFEDFTIAILGLASTVQNVTLTGRPGVSYSPGSVAGSSAGFVGALGIRR